MEFLLDTANVEKIKRALDIYDIVGVTTNPTIISKENVGFWPLLEDIRNTIGDKQLHVQVTGNSFEEMIKEAECIKSRLGADTFIKVPVYEEGLKAIKVLKEEKTRITATAIYSISQALLAASVNADYAAPYYNRMLNLGIDSHQVIVQIARTYAVHNCETKILGASFKNVYQVVDVLAAGGEAVTLSPELFTAMCDNDSIIGAINVFKNDWNKAYGNKLIYEL